MKNDFKKKKEATPPKKQATSSAPALSGNAKAAIYLKVAFADKDKAKAKGAKWDQVKKQWYALTKKRPSGRFVVLVDWFYILKLGIAIS